MKSLLRHTTNRFLCFYFVYTCAYWKGKYTVTAKIADFNTSRLNTNNQQLSFVGTQIFMSPERIIGHPHGVPADIFSLGLTIWMAAEGQHPIEKHCMCKNVQALLLQIAKPVAPIVPSTFSQAFREFISSWYRYIANSSIPPVRKE